EIAFRNDYPLGASTGCNPLRGSASVRRSRPRSALEQQARLSRRADRGARRRADAAGARSRHAARRAGARGRVGVAQPRRRLRGRESDHRPATRPQRRRLREGQDQRARDRRGHHLRRARSRGSRGRSVSSAAPAEVQAAAEDQDSIVAILRARWVAIRSGDVGSLPVIIGIIAIALFFNSKTSIFFSAVNFQNLIGQMAAVSVIGIQDKQLNDISNYVLTKNTGWIVAIILTVALAAASFGSYISRLRAGLPTGNLFLTVVRVAFLGGLAFAAVYVCNQAKPRPGLPLVGLIVVFFVVLGGYVASRTTFG